MSLNDDVELDDATYTEMEPDTVASPSKGVGESRVASAAVIMMGSVLGVYLRHCMQEPSEYGYYSYLFPNFVGSAVAGFLKKNGGRVWYNSFTTGLGVGMCGSLTTFSSWQKAAGTLVGPVHLQSTWHSVYLWGQIEMTGLAVGVAGYDFGWYLGGVYEELRPVKEKPHCPVRERKQTKVKISFDVASVLGSILVAGVVVGLTVYDTTSLLVALCTGPPAAWLRWVLSKSLNPIDDAFPLGTFTANILACATLATCYILQLNIVEHGTTCTFLKGLGDGFCGSLSTVSTFVTEVRNIKSPHRSLIYAFVSMLTAQAVFLGVIGIYTATNSSLAKYHDGTSCLSH